MGEELYAENGSPRCSVGPGGLENGHDAVGVEVDDEVGADGEDAEGSLARNDVGSSGHGGRLGL